MNHHTQCGDLWFLIKFTSPASSWRTILSNDCRRHPAWPILLKLNNSRRHPSLHFRAIVASNNDLIWKIYVFSSASRLIIVYWRLGPAARWSGQIPNAPKDSKRTSLREGNRLDSNLQYPAFSTLSVPKVPSFLKTTVHNFDPSDYSNLVQRFR